MDEFSNHRATARFIICYNCWKKQESKVNSILRISYKEEQICR